MLKKLGKGCLIIVVAVIAVVAIVSVVAVFSNKPESSDTANSNTVAPKKEATPTNRNAPRTVTVGKSFTVGKHRMEQGWTLSKDDFLGTVKVEGDVTNVSTSVSTAIFQIKILRGTRVLANVQCTSSDLEAKQTEAIECFSTAKWPASGLKGTTVTAEATF